MVPKSGAERLIARIVYRGPVAAPVAAGTPIGTLKVWRGDNVILQTPLKAADSIGVGSLPQRAFDAATEFVINLFRSGAERL
jgi:D-alanyl-D-alanine carboxypeptidase (penicillin-binding protein 5/6)